MSPELFSAKNVDFEIHGTRILSQVSLDILSGETVSIVGHNGAGKTTLFHLILGLKFRTGGDLKLDTQDVILPSARRQVGFVPERPYLNLELTFRKILRYLGELSGMSGPELQDRIISLAKEVELSEVVDKQLKTYSKGMLQRTLIAQALLHGPKLLILDEPMSGLDPEARLFLKNKMKQWKQEGKSLLFSSHVIEDVRELADRVGVLDKGKMTYFGRVQDWSPA
ncbi:MAG: ABC transporter ATP-binding protein [Bdellovibrionales bacterium]|nr:ABC transporter ATP-binding protein [Bdellovibrionales bacterium]